MELRDYIRVLRKGWIWILVLVLIGVGAAAAYSLLKSPTYTAESKVFVSTQSGGSTSDLLQGNTYTQDRVTSYANLVGTPAVLLPVIAGLHLDVSASDLAKQISASSPLNTTLLQIDANAGTGKEAADLANATAQSLTNVVKQLETTDADGGVSPVQLSRVQDATVPLAPSSPKVPLNLALGFLVGLALGVAVAVLRETLDTRIRTEHDVTAITDVPIVGGIAFDPKAAAQPLIAHEDSFSARAESFRTLRTNLQFINTEALEGRSFVITSSLPQEGKSSTTANLGLTIADAGATVLVVEADLRRPKLANYLGLEGSVGLTDVLVGRVEIVDALQNWGTSGQLVVLPAGRIPPNPSELLGSKRMIALMEMLEKEFDYVLYDAPPLLPVTDAAILSRETSGTLVIVAATRTLKNQFRAAISTLEQVGTRAAGIVLTMLPTKGPDAYYYGRYGYGGYYGDEDTSSPQKPSRRKRTPGPRRVVATESQQ